jgi:hypothetical protein
VQFHSVEIYCTAKHAEECEFLEVECESIFRPPFADVSELAALPPLLWRDPSFEAREIFECLCAAVTCSSVGPKRRGLHGRKG